MLTAVIFTRISVLLAIYYEVSILTAENLLAEHAVIAYDQPLYGNKSCYGNRPSSQKQVKSKIKPRRYYLPISLFTRAAYDALIAVHATQNRITRQRQNNRIKISVFLFAESTRREKNAFGERTGRNREYAGCAPNHFNRRLSSRSLWAR